MLKPEENPTGLDCSLGESIELDRSFSDSDSFKVSQEAVSNCSLVQQYRLTPETTRC